MAAEDAVSRDSVRAQSDDVMLVPVPGSTEVDPVPSGSTGNNLNLRRRHLSNSDSSGAYCLELPWGRDNHQKWDLQQL